LQEQDKNDSPNGDRPLDLSGERFRKIPRFPLRERHTSELCAPAIVSATGEAMNNRVKSIEYNGCRISIYQSEQGYSAAIEQLDSTATENLPGHYSSESAALAFAKVSIRAKIVGLCRLA
jgi:hypothetical protein